MERNLAFENLQVLNLIQALLGLVSEDLRTVAITCSQEQVKLSFVMYRESDECRKDIDDIVFEFEALQPKRIVISVNVIVEHAQTLKGLGIRMRLVFNRK